MRIQGEFLDLVLAQCGKQRIFRIRLKLQKRMGHRLNPRDVGLLEEIHVAQDVAKLSRDGLDLRIRKTEARKPRNLASQLLIHFNHENEDLT